MKEKNEKQQMVNSKIFFLIFLNAYLVQYGSISARVGIKVEYMKSENGEEADERGETKRKRSLRAKRCYDMMDDGEKRVGGVKIWKLSPMRCE